MKIIVDKNLCLGCGTCVVMAPKTFRLGTDGKAEVIDLPAGKAGPAGDKEETIKEAIDSCPVDAIKSTN